MAHHKPYSKQRWSILQKHEIDAWCNMEKEQASFEHILALRRERYHDLILQHAGDLDETSEILELGCGALCVAQGLEHGKKTYLDPLLDDYRRACPGSLPKGSFQSEMAEDIHQEDAKYDLILALRLLSYVENPELVLHEVERLLKPTGRFLISVEIWPKPLAYLHYYLAQWFPRWLLKKRLYCYTSHGFEKSLKRHFHIEKELHMSNQPHSLFKQEYFYVCRLENT
ncbi:MAG: class I SAM-dependent methyltransferase [Mariprofundaceae bacterium]|nr:class I SAM-dependent methyltransferase [Mariprofundaceae bacterium]